MSGRKWGELLSVYRCPTCRHRGEVRLTPATLQLIEEAGGRWATAQPAMDHLLARRFRPLIADRLTERPSHDR